MTETTSSPFSAPTESGGENPNPAMVDLVGHVVVIIPQEIRLDVPSKMTKSDGSTTEDIVLADVACLTGEFTHRTTREEGRVPLPAPIKPGQIMTGFWFRGAAVKRALLAPQAGFNGWRTGDKPNNHLLLPLVLAQVALGPGKAGQSRPHVLQAVKDPAVIEAATGWYVAYQRQQEALLAQQAQAAVTSATPTPEPAAQAAAPKLAANLAMPGQEAAPAATPAQAPVATTVAYDGGAPF